MFVTEHIITDSANLELEPHVINTLSNLELEQYILNKLCQPRTENNTSLIHYVTWNMSDTLLTDFAS